MTERELLQQPTMRQYILAAYKELLKEMSPEKISVKQIATYAGINRSTFYLHFQDKYEVLHTITEEKLNELVSYYYDKQKQVTTRKNTTMQICEHIYINRTFYKELILNDSFKKRLFQYLFEALLIHMKEEALAKFTAFGTMGFLIDWIYHDCEKPLIEIANDLSSIANTRFYQSSN